MTKIGFVPRKLFVPRMVEWQYIQPATAIELIHSFSCLRCGWQFFSFQCTASLGLCLLPFILSTMVHVSCLSTSVCRCLETGIDVSTYAQPTGIMHTYLNWNPVASQIPAA